jgi:DNA-binding transcriptional regulator YiaG
MQNHSPQPSKIKMNSSTSYRTWIGFNDNSDGGITLYTIACYLSEGCVQKETLFLARLGRIAPTQIVSQGRPSQPMETFMIEVAISCDMSQTFGKRMNSDPKPKRERFEQLTQNQKVKTGKAFAAELRKSKVHPTVKKLTAWRRLNRLSQRKAVVVLAQYYFHATFASLRSWEEGRRSPNSHTAAILEKFLLDHPTVERPKK